MRCYDDIFNRVIIDSVHNDTWYMTVCLEKKLQLIRKTGRLVSIIFKGTIMDMTYFVWKHIPEKCIVWLPISHPPPKQSLLWVWCGEVYYLWCTCVAVNVTFIFQNRAFLLFSSKSLITQQCSLWNPAWPMLQCIFNLGNLPEHLSYNFSKGFFRKSFLQVFS